jgi:hypothetical protein
MHTRKHLLVPPDHREDDVALKSLELASFHLQALPHIDQRLGTCFAGHEGQIPADLAKRKRLVYLLGRTISIVEQGLRICHDRFCNDSHSVDLFRQAETLWLMAPQVRLGPPAVPELKRAVWIAIHLGRGSPGWAEPQEQPARGGGPFLIHRVNANEQPHHHEGN